jgi:hypothetical protein
MHSRLAPRAVVFLATDGVNVYAAGSMVVAVPVGADLIQGFLRA